MEKKITEDEVNNNNDITKDSEINENEKKSKNTEGTKKTKSTTRKPRIKKEPEKEKTTAKKTTKKQDSKIVEEEKPKDEEPILADEQVFDDEVEALKKEFEEKEDDLETETVVMQNDYDDENNTDDEISDLDELKIDEEEIKGIIDEQDIDSYIVKEEKVKEDLDKLVDKKKASEQQTNSKKIKIPLVGLIIVIILIISIIVSIVIFKNKIFNFIKDSDNSAYTDQLPSDNDLNDEEKKGYELISKWLDSYKENNLEITDRIFSYKITSVSLNSKIDNKFIVLATYDVVPASMESSIWLKDNGEKQEDTIKNKNQYFVIENIKEDYKIVDVQVEKPDINHIGLTEEKAILLVKGDFPDSERLKLLISSDMINELTEEQKESVLSTIGGNLDEFYKIEGSYRDTFILGTFLVNKQNSEKWFVDDEGITTKLKTAVQILQIAKFEVQGDLSMTADQAAFVMFNSFPKGKRKSLKIAENWIDTVANSDKVKEDLGDISEFYALKTNDMQGVIVIKKNGLAKYYISPEGQMTDLVGVEDISTIIK